MKTQRCFFVGVGSFFLMTLTLGTVRWMSWSQQPKQSLCDIKRQMPLVDPGDTLVKAAEEAARDPVFPALARGPLLGRANFSRVGQRSCEDVQRQASSAYASIPQRLRPVYTEEEKLVSLLTFHVYIRAMERGNLSYQLYGGTLLGSYRNHGFIPWDDDVDVFMSAKDKSRVESALRAVPSGELLTFKDMHWKFSLRGHRRSPKESFLWPFVDIFFFLEDDVWLWEEYHKIGDGLNYKKRNIFPLSLRPFEGAFLPVARDVESLLNNHYNLEKCGSPSMCHKCETIFVSSVSLPCVKLEGVYPFVSRAPLGNGLVQETLLLGSQVLSVLNVSDPDPLPDSNSYNAFSAAIFWFQKTFLMWQT